jgi:beta-mannosidase
MRLLGVIRLPLDTGTAVDYTSRPSRHAGRQHSDPGGARRVGGRIGIVQAKQRFDLSALNWTVSGFLPTSWKGKSMELGFVLEPEIPAMPASVPGSVQGALRAAGTIPDWFEGLNSRACEWVEHREWMFSARLPDKWFGAGRRFVVECGGLDGNGVIVFNKRQVGAFDNAFVPYRFDLTPHARPADNQLHLVFFTPPRWLGQIGYTSEMKDWKPRFNYTWDWIPRVVQVGPWEPVTLTISEGPEIAAFRCLTDWDADRAAGNLRMKGALAPDGGAARVRLTLRDGTAAIKTAEMLPAEFATGIEWSGLQVAPWWPNGMGERRLYTAACELLDANGLTLDRQEKTVGFRHIAWQPCAKASPEADAWVCAINGKPVFLQGVNWTPIRPTFADLTRDDYRRLVEQYAGMGCNVFRVWGGGYLEKTWFYELCDLHGILVWQEFPLSSSGHENWPHEDEPSMRTLESTAASYIERRQHHASLLMWCGGNELQGGADGSKTGLGRPVGLDHPLMRRWQALVEREDPGRRFVPTSASGPRFYSDARDFGKGLHWDVHGPWKGPGANADEWAKFWSRDDALFRSETGAPGASPAELIRRYAGNLPVIPGTMGNVLWRRFYWWIEWDEFEKDKGREPLSLEEYVDWSQARQAAALTVAVRAAKARFPGIGGMIFWMGHDAFPCTANTSLIDFEGRPKPAALAVAKIWRGEGG